MYVALIIMPIYPTNFTIVGVRPFLTILFCSFASVRTQVNGILFVVSVAVRSLAHYLISSLGGLPATHSRV